MPNDLGIILEEFSKSRLIIEELNLEGQHGISMIRVELRMANLSTSSIFHVIDAKISYNLLVRQPSLHKHGIVASMLYQSLTITGVEKRR